MWNTPGVGGMDGIVTVAQYVYGNAHTDPSSGNITCQHGAMECLDNTLQNCAIKHATNASEWLPFVACLEQHPSMQGEAAPGCARQVGLNWPAVHACWTGPEGAALDAAAGKATPADHTYVPWVTLNGVNTFCSNSNCDNVLQAVCAVYKGPVPKACT